MLKLVKITETYREQLFDMMDEWTATGEKIIPYSIRKNDYHDFAQYLAQLDVDKPTDGLVPDSTFFALDTDTDTFVGAVNIRHYLSERLLACGGHIGDGVRPSRRGEGIGTQMIALALEACKRRGITRVLMVCNRQNIASARTIQKNGGVLENEVVIDGEILQRYWIDNV